MSLNPSTNALRFCGDYSHMNSDLTTAVRFIPAMKKLKRTGGWEDSYAFGVTVANNGAVYSAGLVNKLIINGWNGNDPDYEIIQKPAYWVNDNLNILPGATVNGVMLNEGTARDIKIVDGKIVVLGYLNGMYYDTNNDGIPDDWDSDGTPDKITIQDILVYGLTGRPTLDSQNMVSIILYLLDNIKTNLEEKPL